MACGHVNKVKSGVMRSEVLSGPRSHRIQIPEEEDGALGGDMGGHWRFWERGIPSGSPY